MTDFERIEKEIDERRKAHSEEYKRLEAEILADSKKIDEEYKKIQKEHEERRKEMQRCREAFNKELEELCIDISKKIDDLDSNSASTSINNLNNIAMEDHRRFNQQVAIANEDAMRFHQMAAHDAMMNSMMI